MDSILVTGGAGYIGSHVAKALARSGYLPVVYDNLFRGHREAVQWGPLEVGSLNDMDLLRYVFQKYNPVAVVHLAAYAYVGESMDNPNLYYTNNVCGTLTLLQAMLRSKIRKMVFSSSCAVYGQALSDTIDEDHFCRPINPYGRSKLMIEQILEDHDLAYGIKSVSLRYFNAAGADADCDIGERHIPETHLIPRILQVASGQLKKVDIYGDKHPTHDGTCVRDYVHVSDLARAHGLSVKYLLRDNCSDTINLGLKSGYSVLSVIKTAMKVTGKPIPYEIKPAKLGDPPYLVGSNQRAQDILGWSPQDSSMNNIIKTAWEWHKRPIPRVKVCSRPESNRTP